MVISLPKTYSFDLLTANNKEGLILSYPNGILFDLWGGSKKT